MPYLPNSPQLEAAAAASEMVANDPTQNNPQYDEFVKLKEKVTKYHDSWSGEITETTVRRNLRYMDVDVAAEQNISHFDRDEIYIPVRVINDNITKEAAQYIAYLTSSRNAAVFKPKVGASPALNMALIEGFFTKLVRYPAWELPFFKVLDGAQTHGCDFVEISFDEDKPGHFAIEHLAHEHVWYASDTEKFQRAPCVVRNCRVTREELESFPEVNLAQVEELFKDKEHQKHEESLADVQKVFYRKEGIVYVCWLSYCKSTDFIRAPRPLYLGRKKIVYDSFSGMPVTAQDIYETQYPIEPLPYMISEDGKIKTLKGRAFFDEYIQEATSSMVSSIVNSWHRASNVYGSPKNPTSVSVAMEQTDFKPRNGAFYNQPAEFFHMPYPDSGGMGIVQGLLTQNKAETNQVNFAVNNREDSRKTAREISAASQQAALLSGVQVTLFSIFLRNVWTRCWSIAQSQLEQGLLEDNSLPPEYITQEYELYSAGDSEVIQREETLQRLQQAWPIIAQTPAAMSVLKDILMLAFPSRAQVYVDALEKGDQSTTIINGLREVIGEILQTGRVSPENAQTLALFVSGAQRQQQMQAPIEQQQQAQLTQ